MRKRLKKRKPSPALLVRRIAIAAEIESAFGDVQRPAGARWEQPIKQGRQKTRYISSDRNWHDLVENPRWNHRNKWFTLDSLSLQYYLPAGMMRSLNTSTYSDLAFTLMVMNEGLSDELQKILNDMVLEKTSMLNGRQRLCVKHFLQYMGDFWDHSHFLDDFASGAMDALRHEGNPWLRALSSYWGNLEEADLDLL